MNSDSGSGGILQSTHVYESVQSLELTHECFFVNLFYSNGQQKNAVANSQ